MNYGESARKWWAEFIKDDFANIIESRVITAESPVDFFYHSKSVELLSLFPIDPQAEFSKFSLVARALVRVTEDVPETLPTLLARPEEDAVDAKSTLLSIIGSRSDQDLDMAIRLAMLGTGRKCNIAALIEDLLFWDEKVIVRWHSEFHAADQAEMIL